MICSNCGTENEAGRKFCRECGTALATNCSVCGTANAPDAKFCGNCGTRLSGSASGAEATDVAAPAPAMPSPTPVAERRLVSVLFADLVGFTTLAEGRDPEETRELLTRYFGLAREVIGRHGGMVEKFIGDAVMAVWGAPVAHEDDAERAVRAALALVDGVRTLGPGIEARAGVLTGEAAVTIGATGEGMVAGDLVNTASRLQSVASPGSVLVGEATERAASQAISFEPAGEQTLKGKQSPVPAFRALRVVAEVGGRNRAGGLEAPFVGRDDDFRLLKELFHSTGRDRRPRLVSIMGPAGIGKSRLAWEFSKYSDGLVEDTYWHAGRSPSYGEGVTFWALGEMIRRRAGLLETDDEATTREKIRQSVEEYVGDPPERRWIETALLALLGLGEAPPGGRDELFSAWRTFFERIAEQGTTVLLFEDLQWADSGQLDFIDHLLDWTKSLPLFVITLSRPDLLERRPDWGAGRRNFVSITLDPLPESAMQELLEGLVPGLPPKVTKTIIERADGIPLYAVETVRMLVAEGRLREDTGVYRPVGDLAAIAIPETLTALIAARLDGLDATQRTILQDAAVLGQSFTVAGLAAVTSLEPDQLSPVLADFVRRELMTVDADPRSPERGQYSFMQALIREVAYNQLARNERKVRHLAAARWFESLGEEELASALAGHYLSAFRNAPPGPEADALAGQARISLRAAAERAANLGSHAQAVAFLTTALEITEDQAERAALLERAGREATDITPGAARAHLDAAMAIYRALGDLRGVARAATGISIALHLLYRPAEAVPILQEAVEETAEIASEPDAIRLLAELARSYALTRDPRALDLVDRVLELAEPLELMPIIAEGLINRALVLSLGGRHYEPAALLRGVLPITEASGLTDAQMRALNNLAASLLADDVRETARLLEQGVELSRRTGALGSVGYFRGSLVYPQLLSGRWDEIEVTLVEMDDADPADASVLEFFTSKAIFHAYRGDDTNATATLESLRPILAKTSQVEYIALGKDAEVQIAALGGRLEVAHSIASDGMRLPLSELTWSLASWAARVAFWMGDAERARAAVENLEALPLPGRVVHAAKRQVRAGMDALEGRHAQALAGYRDALARWRELDLPVYLGLCLIDFATLVGPNDREAAAAAEEARTLWTQLGSPPMLARLEEGLARWTGDKTDRVSAEVSEAVESSKPA